MADRRILIVEDSATMRQLIGFALRRLGGVELVEAENGALGLELLAEQTFDVVLLDLNMPVMNGFAFLERLPQAIDAPPPVIVITTEGAQEDVDRAFSLGAKAYVTKPVQAAGLASVVQRVLEG